MWLTGRIRARPAAAVAAGTGRRLAVVVAAASVVALASAAARTVCQPAVAQDEVAVYLPLALRGIDARSLPKAMTAPPTARPTRTPSPTWTSVPVPATITPLPTFTPEPTPPPNPAAIRGLIVFDRQPLPAGFGEVGGPQIELRRCDLPADEPCRLRDWQVVLRTVSQDGGAFVFGNAPPLSEDQRYQVWWTNEDTPDVQGDSRFLHHWWSRAVDALAPGDDVDLGTFDVTDLKYKAICHDCGQSLPITFEWTPRSNRSESYQWSLFRGCGNIDNREGAWRTRPLRHAKEYTLESAPPGFRLDEKYCWYVFIDDGENGTGWPFFDWRVTFLATP